MSKPYHVMVAGNGPQANRILASLSDLDSAKRLAQSCIKSGKWGHQPILVLKRMGPNGDGNHFSDEYHYNLAQG